MTTIQLVINGNQVEGQIDEIAKILSMVSETMAQPVSSILKEELVPFNQFAIKELTPHLGQELSEKIVAKLEKCADSNYPDFRYFIGMYKEVAGNIEHRQLLKTLSAVYRFKFGRYMNHNAVKFALKSEIKYATICPHCGAVANAFVQRLIKEGLWK
jgi:DNA topoisomerase VI subunit B